MIVGTIAQSGMILEIDNTTLYQWSENLQLKVQYDETFIGWSKKWDAIGSKKKKRIPLDYDDETQCITLNKNCFIDDMLFIACAFIRDDHIINTNPVNLFIANSINHALDTVPDIPGLYDEMRILFKQISENEYLPVLDKLQKDLRNEMVALTDDAYSKIGELTTEAKAQQAVAKSQQKDAENQQLKAIENQEELSTFIDEVNGKIERGELNGNTGLTVPSGMWFTLGVKPDGHLYVRTLDGHPKPPIFIGSDGRLKIRMKEVS